MKYRLIASGLCLLGLSGYGIAEQEPLIPTEQPQECVHDHALLQNLRDWQTYPGAQNFAPHSSAGEMPVFAQATQAGASRAGRSSSPTGLPEFLAAAFSPAVIFGNGQDQTRVRVRLDREVEQVSLVDAPGHFLLNGEPLPNQVAPLTLLDDGWWELEGLTSLANDVFAPLRVRVVTLGSVVEFDYLSSIYFVIDPEQPASPAISLGPQARRTTNLINLRDDDGLFTALDLDDQGLYPTTAQLRATTEAVYELLPDHYDLIAWFSTQDMSRPFLHLRVQNQVDGLGLDLFDDSANWGSSGRLLGISAHGLSKGDVMHHEATHQFGVRLDPALGLDDGFGHWGVVDIPGYLLGFNFEALEDGRFRIARGRGPFSVPAEDRVFPPMELYLWGLLPADEVPPVTVLEGVPANQLFLGNTVTPTAVRSVLIDDIIEHHGPRQPAAGEAPTVFRKLGVLVSSGRWATPAELALWDRAMRHYASGAAADFMNAGIPSFQHATGQRGDMLTTLDPDALTGAWYDPASPGQGFNLQLSPAGLFGYYYGYDDDGQPLWLAFGNHTDVVGWNRPFSLPVVVGEGGVFGAPGGVRDWGEIEFNFLSCNVAEARLTRLDGVQQQQFQLQKLAAVTGSEAWRCGIVPDPDDHQARISGAWFDPATAGQGWNFVQTPGGLLGYYYGYDAQGNRLWLVSGELIPTLELDQVYTMPLLYGRNGGRFDQPIPPEQLETWGSVRLSFESCLSGSAELQGVDGTEIQQLQMLAPVIGVLGCD